MLTHTKHLTYILVLTLIISAAKDGKYIYIYIGMLFIPSINITEIIQANLNRRAFNIKTFCDWLDINENTPMEIKLQMLETCK